MIGCDEERVNEIFEGRVISKRAKKLQVVIGRGKIEEKEKGNFPGGVMLGVEEKWGKKREGMFEEVVETLVQTYIFIKDLTNPNDE